MSYDRSQLREIINTLRKRSDASDEQLKALIENGGCDSELFAAADETRRERYGTDVYVRGLIEFTNYCRNDCFYCGIRRSNKNVPRYRMTPDEIMSCCEKGYRLGFRTFVLQGGEDMFFTDEIMCGIISSLHGRFPDCAITLSLGERPRESYERYFRAGARRYLLRQETASDEHYSRLHPDEMSGENRKKCLFDLKETGYQVGTGIMVGSPYQTSENIVADLRFMQRLSPDMIGIGRFISHRDTPFAGFENGTLELTLRLIAILRLMFPHALIPATTALGTIDPNGREMGLKAGANVVMPNLSPADVREKYQLYDNKICLSDDAEKCKSCLEDKIKAAGYRTVVSAGDVKR